MGIFTTQALQANIVNQYNDSLPRNSVIENDQIRANNFNVCVWHVFSSQVQWTILNFKDIKVNDTENLLSYELRYVCVTRLICRNPVTAFYVSL